MTRLFSETSLCEGPLDLLAVVRSHPGRPGFYIEREGLAIAGVGSAAAIVASGPDRFAAASVEALRMLNSIRSVGDIAADRIAVGGFAFGDEVRCRSKWREFPALLMFFPRMLWVLRDGICRFTRTWRDGCREDAEMVRCIEPVPVSRTLRLRRITAPNDREMWRKRVECARTRIEAGLLGKVVMARSVECIASERIDPAILVARARGGRRSCFNFWIRNARTSFIGSTPELLVRIRAGEVFSGALAGSAPRSVDPGRDRAMREELHASVKNLAEHRFVVETIRSTLSGVADLTANSTPELVSLPEAHHLLTRVAGRMRVERTALEVAGMLHPTPAVCGVPAAAAREIIQSDEAERGWYSGGVGWMDAQGQGEFAVALRSLLIEGQSATAWAGAGIVDGSEPDAEFHETEFKLAAMLGDADA
jgi:menaquinone-specific isochorismate synthase